MHGPMGFDHLTRMDLENQANVTNILAERVKVDLFNSSTKR
jgi:hypothetical protein